MEPEPIKYACTIQVAGILHHCIEDYDAVHSRLVNSDSPTQPVELMIGADYGDDEGGKRLIKAAFMPLAISAVFEIPADIAKVAP
jgi:hypothetical protein